MLCDLLVGYSILQLVVSASIARTLDFVRLCNLLLDEFALKGIPALCLITCQEETHNSLFGIEGCCINCQIEEPRFWTVFAVTLKSAIVDTEQKVIHLVDLMNHI
jgi:hypothetical protein